MSDLLGNPEARFSCVAAQIILDEINMKHNVHFTIFGRFVRKPIFVVSNHVRHKPTLYYRRWFAAGIFGFRKLKDSTMH